MGFEIAPAAVQGVVNAVKGEATELSDGIDVESLEGDVSAMASAPAPGAAQAVAEFLGHESPVIQSIGNRITACLLGVTTVTNSYTTASDEMLQTVQSKAIASAESGDFSYFGVE
jgi:hypothetical protein